MTKDMIEQMIIKKIQDELDSNKQEKNLILRNFPNSLLTNPLRKDFYNDWSKKLEDYWIVFDEMPNDSKEGYLIIYDESTDEFGLAMKTSMISDKGIFIGLHGSFIDTLIDM